MICVSLQNRDFERCREIVSTSQMVEVRADLCRLSLEQLGELSKHPNTLVTCRVENSSVEYATEQLLHAIRSGASYVDVEIEAPENLMATVRTCAKEFGCKFIISYHNFQSTESILELEQIYALCKSKGADIVKIVTTATTTQDSVRVLSLYDSPLCGDVKEGSLVAFAMGKAGQFTRTLCLHRGAPFTYVSADAESATAPGQYTLQQMESYLSSANYPYIFKGEAKLPSRVTIPCSKSVAQRAIIAAALCDGVSRLSNYAPCNDIDGAISVVRGLGCRVDINGSTLIIEGLSKERLLDISSIMVGESGLLTRLLIPLCSYIYSITGRDIEISGVGSILGRELGESVRAMQSAGVRVDSKSKQGAYLPFVLSGEIASSEIEFSGSESSQVVSGFLMTLPLLKQDTTLKINNPSSVPYIELTLKTLRDFGIEIDVVENTSELLSFSVKGNQQYRAANIYMDADWSSAAAFMVGGAISGDITLCSMPINSLQADEKLLDVLSLCGVEVSCKSIDSGNLVDLLIKRREPLKCFDFDATHSPDLFPVLTLLALHCEERSRISGVGRLMQKESNRAQSIYSEFTKLGGKIDIIEDVMFVSGSTLCGGQLSSHNDHRIAMSLITASLFVDEDIALDNIACIDKSFPLFLDRLSVGIGE